MPSLSDAEEILAHRGIDVSYETIRYWTTKFGPKSAANLRRRKLPIPPRWHLDEMVSTSAGERVWIWRTVDDEDEVMDMIVQKQRSDRTAACLLRRLLKNQNVEPQRIVADEHRSWGAALERPGLSERHHLGRLRHNTRTRNSHLTIRRRDWKMQGFKKAAISVALPGGACRDLQHVRFAAPHDQPAGAPGLPGTVGRCSGEGGRLSGILRLVRGSGCRRYPDRNRRERRCETDARIRRGQRPRCAPSRPKTASLTAFRAGDTVAYGQTGRFEFLFPTPPN